jgi:hypothetical protein
MKRLFAIILLGFTGISALFAQGRGGCRPRKCSNESKQKRYRFLPANSSSPPKKPKISGQFTMNMKKENGCSPRNLGL